MDPIIKVLHESPPKKLSIFIVEHWCINGGFVGLYERKEICAITKSSGSNDN
jgi:hypothetical protein